MKFCSKCGKELHDDAVVCPGCGCAVESSHGTYANTSQVYATYIPKKAKTARIFGILGLLLLYPLGIPAIVLAVKSKEETCGEMCGAAKAGFVCGIIALCFWALGILVMISSL